VRCGFSTLKRVVVEGGYICLFSMRATAVHHLGVNTFKVLCDELGQRKPQAHAIMGGQEALFNTRCVP